MVLLGLCGLWMVQDLMQASNWDLGSGNAHFVRHFGRDCLVLEGNTAMLKGISMVNGEMEADLYTSGKRGFGGFIFRAESADEFELLYLRTHKSGQPDAIQYTPRYNGSNGWQLFHGEGFESSGLLNPDGWTHVRLRFQGGALTVYLNGSSDPAFHTTRLQRGIKAGGIGLWGSLGAILSNFTFRELPEGGEPPQPPTVVEGAIVSWTLSPAFPESTREPGKYPNDILGKGEAWQAVRASTDGLLVFNRYVRQPPGGKSLAYARTTITADRDRWVQLRFGYSDDLVMFLNGQPLFSGKAGFQSRSPAFLGLVGTDYDAVFLPLRKGENELVMAVSEVFGGWGIKTQLVNAEGLDL